jgi:signal transduction histidine kinase
VGRRIAAAIAGVAILALLLYAGPRTIVVVDLVRDQETEATNRSADLISAAIDRRVREGRTFDADTFTSSLRPGERLTIRRDGDVDTTGDTDGDPSFHAERALATGGTVTIELGDAVVDERVSEALESIAIAATAVLVVSVLVAVLLSRRMVRPFVALSEYAGRLQDDLGDDTGAAPAPPPTSGISEADSLAVALSRTSDRVRELVARERQFSANASHQLRTPLAALRLRLEDVTLWPDVPAAVRVEMEAAITEVDRLADTTTDLLELARRGGIGTGGDVVVEALVGEVVDGWRPVFGEAGRAVDLRTGGEGAVVETSERSLRQVLDVLLDNALVHGDGAVEVEVCGTDGDVAIRVCDAGCIAPDMARRVFERSVRSPATGGSGIGLALAQTIAEALGARLSLISRDPTTFEVRLRALGAPTARG